jgi:hypothetical protein
VNRAVWPHHSPSPVKRADQLAPLSEPLTPAAVQPPARGWPSLTSW